MNIAVLIICLIIMLLGLAGAVLPVLPGIPVIWLAMLAYGWFMDWVPYGLTAMLVTGFLVILTVVVDQLATVLGARKFGASRAGMIGSVLGAVLGVIFFNIIGLILGAFFGAVAGELTFGGRNLRESMNSGLGALLGFLAGSLFKFALGMGLIVYFLYAIIF
ncbi:MAG: DUF456 domain-containing protein [Candidatus Adiutrix sp.]|jgi:uncharacterized protein YqgC (DUF456 family)|nr:DUF456 domain-containing protein [Candidatus Adiutrix sp.]